MSEDLVHCRSCHAVMELHTLYKTRYEDGIFHLIKEYRCKLCRSILIKEHGEVTPSGKEIPETVADEMIVE